MTNDCKEFPEWPPSLKMLIYAKTLRTKKLRAMVILERSLLLHFNAIVFLLRRNYAQRVHLVII